MADLRQLRVFVAVAEELNFTRAAERLHMAQQAVSKSVKALERELGVELLVRTTREVRLTPAGEALLARGPAVLAAADAAFSHAREVGRGEGGTVRVGTSPALGPVVVEQIVSALRSSGAGVSVRDVRPRDVARALRDRELDLVVARTLRPSSDVDSAALAPTPVVLAVPDGHRLRGRATLRDLDGERLLVMSAPGTPYTDLLLRRLAAAGAHVEPVESRILVAAGLIELAPKDAVAILPAGWTPVPGTRLVELDGDLTLPLLVAWPMGVRPRAVELLREAFRTTR